MGDKKRQHRASHRSQRDKMKALRAAKRPKARQTNANSDTDAGTPCPQSQGRNEERPGATASRLPTLGLHVTGEAGVPATEPVDADVNMLTKLPEHYLIMPQARLPLMPRAPNGWPDLGWGELNKLVSDAGRRYIARMSTSGFSALGRRVRGQATHSACLSRRGRRSTPPLRVGPR